MVKRVHVRAKTPSSVLHGQDAERGRTTYCILYSVAGASHDCPLSGWELVWYHHHDQVWASLVTDWLEGRASPSTAGGWWLMLRLPLCEGGHASRSSIGAEGLRTGKRLLPHDGGAPPHDGGCKRACAWIGA
jgi:hypothetical protein